MIQDKTISIRLEYVEKSDGSLPDMVMEKISILDHVTNKSETRLSGSDIVIVCTSLLESMKDSMGHFVTASILNEISKQVMLGHSADLKDLQSKFNEAQDNERQQGE